MGPRPRAARRRGLPGGRCAGGGRADGVVTPGPGPGRGGAAGRSSVAGGRHGSVAAVPHQPVPHRAAPPRRTTVPPTPRSRVVSLTAGTAAGAGLGMIPLPRLPGAVRGGYVLLP